MARRPRILLNVLTTASVLTFVTAAVLHTVSPCLHPTARMDVCFRDGDVTVWKDSPHGKPKRVFDPVAGSADDRWSFAGFGWQRVAWRYGASSPVWPYLPAEARAQAALGFGGVVTTTMVEFSNALPWLMCLSAVLPLGRVAFGRRRELRLAHCAENNLCTSCGYDLRGTPESCPECGTVPPWVAEERAYRKGSGDGE